MSGPLTPAPASESERDPQETYHRWTLRVLHAATATVASGFLWAHSVPGVYHVLALTTAFLLCCLLVFWLTRTAASLRARTGGWTLGVFPLLIMITIAAMAVDAPVQARWAPDRAEFDQLVAAMPTEQREWVGFEVPATVGSFRITHADRVPGGALFFEETSGWLWKPAGFAYLPDGPSDLRDGWDFYDPRFRHLGGPWYAWTASRSS